MPRALLVYRIENEQIVPAFFGERDHPWLRCLLEERERFVGGPRRELAARLAEGLAMASPARRRALAAHVLDGLGGARPRATVAARELRAKVFVAAAAPASQPSSALRASSAPRAQIVAEVAAQAGLSVVELERALFADLPGEQPVAALSREVAPVELATRANLALACGLLARADHVRVELEGNALPVVRLAKLRGLIVNVSGTADRAVLEISGPLSLFHHTRVYGRALGELLPQLAWSTRFALSATCHLAEGSAQLRLSSADQICPADEPRRYDSALEERFARAMRRHAPDWDVIRDPRPLVAGAALVFPDFALVHRSEGRRWLVEIVGFWTPAYLAHKLAAYRAADAPRLVLCIDERRRCSEGDLPADARIVWFRRRIDPGAVLAAIEGSEPNLSRSEHALPLNPR